MHSLHYRLHAADQRLIAEQSLVHPVFIVYEPRSVISTRSLQRDNIDRRVQFAHFLHIPRRNERETVRDRTPRTGQLDFRYKRVNARELTSIRVDVRQTLAHAGDASQGAEHERETG